MSLRGIVDETSLGLRTVRTIIDQSARKDRTSRKYLERVHLDRQQQRIRQSRKRTRDALPKRINAELKTSRDLAKAAKGIG